MSGYEYRRWSQEDPGEAQETKLGISNCQEGGRLDRDGDGEWHGWVEGVAFREYTA
jgi:hypothetical protein